MPSGARFLRDRNNSWKIFITALCPKIKAFRCKTCKRFTARIGLPFSPRRKRQGWDTSSFQLPCEYRCSSASGSGSRVKQEKRTKPEPKSAKRSKRQQGNAMNSNKKEYW